MRVHGELRFESFDHTAISQVVSDRGRARRRRLSVVEDLLVGGGQRCCAFNLDESVVGGGKWRRLSVVEDLLIGGGRWCCHLDSRHRAEPDAREAGLIVELREERLAREMAVH